MPVESRFAFLLFAVDLNIAALIIETRSLHAMY